MDLRAKDLLPDLLVCDRKGQRWRVIDVKTDRDGYLMWVNLVNYDTGKMELFNKTVFKEFGFHIAENTEMENLQ